MKNFKLSSLSVLSILILTNTLFAQYVELSISPGSQTIDLSVQDYAEYVVSITPLSGFTGTVTLSASSDISGATYDFSSNDLNPPYQDVTITIYVSQTTEGGTYTIDVAANNGNTMLGSSSCQLEIISIPEHDGTLIQISSCPFGSIREIQFEGDDIWVGSFNGLAKYDLQFWNIYTEDNSDLPENRVIEIYINKVTGDKWIGTDGGGIAKFDGTNWEVFNTSNSGLPDNYIYSINIDASQNVWAGTYYGGLAKYDGASWTVFDPSNTPIPGYTIFSLEFDQFNNLYVGGDQGSLVKYDGIDWELIDLSAFSPINDFSVVEIEFDNEDNLWIGTSAYGFGKFVGKGWEIYSVQNSNSPSDIVFNFKFDSFGHLWMILKQDYFGQVYFFDRENLWIPIYGFGHGPVIINVDENDDKWVGSQYGLYFYGNPENIPVELISFSYSVSENRLNLEWTTATETNNLGFEIQKSKDGVNFSKIGFVRGAGNSTEINRYSFADNFYDQAVCYYRLKQIDFDGTFSYSEVIPIEYLLPKYYKLSQNYPNPFNPKTNITYSLPENNFVELKIFNALGEEIATLVNEFKSAGSYDVTFDANNLSGGIYFYKIKAGSFNQVRKMILLK